jgi:hypothetical protein
MYAYLPCLPRCVDTLIILCSWLLTTHVAPALSTLRENCVNARRHRVCNACQRLSRISDTGAAPTASSAPGCSASRGRSGPPARAPRTGPADHPRGMPSHKPERSHEFREPSVLLSHPYPRSQTASSTSVGVSTVPTSAARAPRPGAPPAALVVGLAGLAQLARRRRSRSARCPPAFHIGHHRQC